MGGTLEEAVMKKVYRAWMVACGALLLFASVALGACGEKKDKATATLQAGEGGALTQSAYEIEVGASLSDALKDVKPTPEEGLEFAGWYLGGEALQADDVMPAEGVTLTAKYYATYTVKLYMQTVTGEYGEAQTSQGKAIYGEPFTYTPAVEHYEADDEKTNKTTSEHLGKDETFEVYLAREAVSLVYNANAPAGETIPDGVVPYNARYGETVTLMRGEDFDAPALYRFAGWAESANGEIVYKSGDTLTLEGNVSLYAVWDKGYTDRFKGADILFCPQTDATQAVLVRAGNEYLGTREGDVFTFADGNRTILKGKTAADGTFVYYRDAQKDVEYKHYNSYEGILHTDGATLKLDGEGRAVYTAGTTTDTGDLYYDPSTMFYTFRGTGENVFEFMLTTYGDDDIPVFIREGAEIGIYSELSFVYDGELLALHPTVLRLDGTGIALLYDVYDIVAGETMPIGVGSYVPESDSEISINYILLEDESTGRVTVKLLTYDGQNAFIFYEEDADDTFTATDGGTLTLDGYSGTYESAVYTPATGDAVKGMYVIVPSYGWNTVYLFPQTGDMLTFRIKGDVLEVAGDGDEYLRYNGDSGDIPVGAPLLILGKNGAKLVRGNGQEMAGTVAAVDGKEGRYRFTSTDQQVVFEYVLGGDYFTVNGKSCYLRYYSYYPAERAGAANQTALTEQDGTGKILLEETDTDRKSGNALWTDGAEEHAGAYVVNAGDALGLTYDVLEFHEISTGSTYVFKLAKENDEYAKFAALQGESGYYTLYGVESGEPTAALTLFYDGTTRVATYVDAREDGILTHGTYTYSSSVATVTIGTATYHYLLVEEDGAHYFIAHTSLWDGEKTFTCEGETDTLKLDGYGFADCGEMTGARYVISLVEEPNGTVYRVYLQYGTDEMGIGEYFDIDLTANKYERCHYFWGYYDASDTSGGRIYVDGHGGVTLFNIAERDNNDMLIPQKTGKYTARITDDEQTILTIVYGEGADEETVDVLLWVSVGEEGSAKYYTVAFGADGTYVSPDRELLTFNQFGKAYFTDVYGITYEGTCTQLSAHVFSFEGSKIEGQQIFKIASDGTFTHPTTGFVTDNGVLLKYLGGSKEVKIPDGITEIAPTAFSEHEQGSRYRGADIETLDLNDVERVGESAFNGCAALISVVGNKVTYLGKNAFYACIELASADLPKLVTIDENAFHLCQSLTEATFDEVTTVYSSAFSNCDALTTVHLLKAEKLYEGVFFDCYALETVVLGGSLTQLGTPDEPVAGVFSRMYTTDPMAAITVQIEVQKDHVPTVGLNLFEGVEYYSIVLNDIEVVKAFYKTAAWKDYNSNVGAKSAYDGVYYRYQYGMQSIVLNGRIWMTYGSAPENKGAYYVGTDKKFHVLAFNESEAEKYTDTIKGEIDANGALLYDHYNYGDTDKEDWFYFVAAGKEITLSLGSDSIKFTPATTVGNLYHPSVTVYSVSGKWTKSGETKDVTVQLRTDMYYTYSLSMLYDGDRYAIESPSVNASASSASLGSPVFDPVVTTYEAEDTSYLALAQRDKAATDYTASFVLAGIRDGNEQPISCSNIPVERDGSKFTAEEAVIFDGYSYEFTFEVQGETFTYTYEREKRTVIAAGNTARVLVFQKESGEVTQRVLEIDRYGYDEWTEISEITENFTHAQTGNTENWRIYEYNYAGDYTLTTTGSGNALHFEVTCGKVVKGYENGVYVIAFYADDALDQLYMRGADYVYGEVESGDITEETGYYEVTFQGNRYYITLDPEQDTVTIVFASVVLTGTEWEGGGQVAGTVTVVRNPQGVIQSVTLKIGETEYTQYTLENDAYLFTAGEKYYLVDSISESSASCDINELSSKNITHAASGLSLTLLAKKNNTVVKVLSVKLNNADATIAETKALYIGGEDYLYIKLTTNEEYLIMVADGVAGKLAEQTLTTADGKYRVTVIMTDTGVVYTAIKFEVQSGTDFAKLEIQWVSPMGNENYNLEVDAYVDGTYVCHYFLITVSGSTVTISLDHCE